MSSFIIIGLIVVGIGFVAFVVTLQMKEQARLEKLRKVAMLNNQTRQVRHYLDDLPPQYQPKDMRLWLYSRLVGIHDDLIKLAPDDKLARRRSHVVEEMERFQGSKQRRKAKPINDELLIINIRRLLDSFFSFIQQSKDDKKLDPDSCHKYTQLIGFYRYKLNADHKAYQARQFFLTGKMQDAVDMYRTAAGELSEIEETPEAKEAIDKFNSAANEIESDLKLQQQEAEASAEDEEEEEGLDDEWSKFMEEGEFTKKKTF